MPTPYAPQRHTESKAHSTDAEIARHASFIYTDKRILSYDIMIRVSHGKLATKLNNLSRRVQTFSCTICDHKIHSPPSLQVACRANTRARNKVIFNKNVNKCLNIARSTYVYFFSLALLRHKRPLTRYSAIHEIKGSTLTTHYSHHSY